ncbi:MAG: RagB/SusD family nutrient uptake outer membrane protein [Bacteroidaceae bacterium]|nr:RagB/SusD family nutrient uptake outer membrane protein [Bacteroidaceae bacterium]
MKKINNILKSFILIVLLGCTTLFTSCTDYLTVYPTNAVIHERYWQTADDVNGMVAATYLELLSDDAISRYIVWGELRADNLNITSTTSQELKYIVEANLMSDNSYSSWNVFYKAINYANYVLEFAPLVPDRDPNFTHGDLDIVLGEMYAIRALSHFYLVRTFRDIPLSYKASFNDSELPDYPQVHPLVALDSIMHDLERAEYLVMRSGAYPAVHYTYNYGRITRNAVRAMKADVALWQAAFAEYCEGEELPEGVVVRNRDDYYRECIECCDSVIDAMNKHIVREYEKNNNPELEEMGPGTENPYYLTLNEEEPNVNKTRESWAYNSIFGFGNSMLESIFELQFDQDKNVNGVLMNLYGRPDAVGQLCVSRAFVDDKSSKYNNKQDDLRVCSFTTAAKLTTGGASAGSDKKEEVRVAKYVASSSPAATEREGVIKDAFRESSKCDANWIFYRKTDVMLMKAEALALLSSPTEEELSASFELVKAVNDRSIIKKKEALKQTNNYKTAEGMHALVLDERLRELSFEGKRWYDLVRKALREKSTKNILFVADKLTSNQGAVKAKLSSIDALFFPIAEREIDINPLLKQNPAFEKSESIQQQ